MELSKQEMELFLLLSDLQSMELFIQLSDLQSKNIFYKKFIAFKNGSKTGFENRKCVQISVSLAPAWNPAQPELSLGQGYSCIHIHVGLYV